MRLPTLWGREGGDPFAGLHRDMEKLFDDFTKNWPSVSGRGALAPSIDVSESDKAIEVTAELPGVDEKDVEVTLADNVLTIKGEKKSEHEEKTDGRVVSERSYGMFRRSFSLPFEVAGDKVDAKFDKGVLKITLPKSPELAKKTKKIAIKAGK